MDRRAILGNRARLILFLFLVLIGVFWIWGYVSSKGFIDKIIELIQLSNSSRNIILSIAIFWLFSVISVLLGPLTSAPLVPIAILLWGNWATFWLLFSGWITGGIIAYSIGRHLGHAIVWKILSADKIKTWEEFISRRVNFLAAFLFRLAMPAETGYVFGLAHYDFIKYIGITSIIEAVTAAILVFAGKALIDQNLAAFIFWVAIVIITLAASAYFLARRIRKAKAL